MLTLSAPLPSSNLVAVASSPTTIVRRSRGVGDGDGQDSAIIFYFSSPYPPLTHLCDICYICHMPFGREHPYKPTDLVMVRVTYENRQWLKQEAAAAGVPMQRIVEQLIEAYRRQVGDAVRKS